jgi:glycerol kinase
VVEAMNREAGARIRRLRVDGGASLNDFLMQFQADILGVPIERPSMVETTALGAAHLAGIGVGLWAHAGVIPGAGGVSKVFQPGMTRAQRDRQVAGWQAAVSLLLSAPRRPRASRSSSR